MIPKTLDQWTKEAILDLLRVGIMETDEFDFKLVPEKQKQQEYSGREEKSRLDVVCSSFANSNGGFLIFGIKDEMGLSPEERLVGMEEDKEFFTEFGSFPAKCTPYVEWIPKNPPIKLDSGRVVHVIYIPKSWKAPHATLNKCKVLRFVRRTSKGSEDMSYEEIRNSFLGLYEKRIRLQLLKSELNSLIDAATQICTISARGGRDEYSFITFDTSIMDATIAEIYPILAEASGLYQSLGKVRMQASQINNKSKTFFAIAEYPLVDRNSRISQHNRDIIDSCITLKQMAVNAIQLLDPVLRQ